LVKPLMTACNVPPRRAMNRQARQNRQQEDLQRIFFISTIETDRRILPGHINTQNESPRTARSCPK
jgi:hypothetical protein